MSFNKRYLPSIESLKEDYEKLSLSEFYIRHIKRVDAFIGATESLDFINEVFEEYKQEINKKPENK